MNGSGPHSHPWPWRQAASGLLAVALMYGAPATAALRQPAAGLVNNVHRGCDVLPADAYRVALLPLSAAADYTAVAGTLDSVLHSELVRTKRFEVVTLPAERLAWRTGRSAWSGEEEFPADFFAILRRETGCDAVLFARLVVLRAYPPLAVGWRLRLVDARSLETLWAAEEVFDAAQPEVARAARRFDGADATGWGVLHSPRRFAGFAAAHLLETLPARTPAKKAKVFLKGADTTAERRP